MIKKENILKPQLDCIDNAYQIINGKHLLHEVMYLTKEGNNKHRCEHFRNLLARSVKKEVGLHKDIVEIMQHILPSTPC